MDSVVLGDHPDGWSDGKTLLAHEAGFQRCVAEDNYVEERRASSVPCPFGPRNAHGSEASEVNGHEARIPSQS